MSVVSRGTRNAFRNLIRSFSITVILAISIGLALVMMLSMRAVQGRIDSVKSSIGNTITVTPAGSRGFQGGGEPLTVTDTRKIQNTPHVTKVTVTLGDRLTQSTDTNLVSSIDPGTLGTRFNRRGGGEGSGGPSGSSNGTFTLPIMVTGTNDPTSTQAAGSSQLKITSGMTIDGTKDANMALVGLDLATKNNLKVGQTFSAYGQTVTVVGVYDAGNRFANAGLIMPLPTVQRLSGQSGDVSTAIVQVDSITNLAPTVSALQSSLGPKADVISAQDTSSQALGPLENIQSISLYSLAGALVAGSTITFLTMLMIVRERRREIGVLKAIGSSNFKIVGQFVVEALTLTSMGAVLGVIGGVFLSQPVLQLLVKSNTQMAAGRMGGGRFGGLGRLVGEGSPVANLQTAVGYDILLYGLLAAIAIAVLGSAIPSWVIAKVRPAEVMRAE